jgi:hypothetical protein
MSGWAKAKPANAAARSETATLVPIGTGITATLLPTARVAYAVRPGKPGGPGSNGGIFAFVVPAAGRYRVAVGSGVWIDVLRGTTPVTSVAHAHGPRCSAVRKMVDFDLQPGRYVLQIAGSGPATLSMMVSRLS